jgi:hypothetical protein
MAAGVEMIYGWRVSVTILFQRHDSEFKKKCKKASRQNVRRGKVHSQLFLVCEYSKDDGTRCRQYSLAARHCTFSVDANFLMACSELMSPTLL